MVPKLYIGPPGVGKTASVCSQYDYTEVVLLSSSTEEDLSGLPFRDGHIEYRTQPAMFRRLNEAAAQGKRVCLFLDELDKARREVADTLLTLIVSRRLGEWALPEGCDIVAAANPPEWGGGSGISRAMQTRFSIIRYKPSIPKWCEWLNRTYPGLLANRISAAVTRGSVPLFEHCGDGYDFRLTCPRTWEMAIQAMLSGGPDVEDTVSGLLTPNAVSFLFSEKDSSADVSDLQNKARSIAEASMRSHAPSRKVNPIQVDYLKGLPKD